MKKKLKLADIQVSSFITEAASDKIRGGSGDHKTIELRDCIVVTRNLPSVNPYCTQAEAYCNSVNVCATGPYCA